MQARILRSKQSQPVPECAWWSTGFCALASVAGANIISGERALLTRTVLEPVRLRFAGSCGGSLVKSLSGSLWGSSPDTPWVTLWLSWIWNTCAYWERYADAVLVIMSMQGPNRRDVNAWRAMCLWPTFKVWYMHWAVTNMIIDWGEGARRFNLWKTVGPIGQRKTSSIMDHKMGQER